ncbi:MAG: cell division protein ZipA [Methylococcaceae bacterium]|nr:cell division protein ZipA [Methylococcaceae bacterium]
MDKELLRIVIITTGLMIIMGMLLWGYFKSQRPKIDSEFFRDDSKAKLKLASKTDESENEADYPKFRYEAGLENDFDDFDDLDDNRPHPHKKNPVNAAHQEQAVKETPPKQQSQPKSVQPPQSKPMQQHHAILDHSVASVDKAAAKQQLPRLVQFSIVSKTEQGFNGADLDAFFNAVGLQYGSVKIYERLDMERKVDFCVASMINPGTFPDTNLEAFYTPGITFFMQPQELPEPVIVFDDLVRTINLLAMELEGDVWDAARNLLTEASLKTIRKSLQIS